MGGGKFYADRSGKEWGKGRRPSWLWKRRMRKRERWTQQKRTFPRKGRIVVEFGLDETKRVEINVKMFGVGSIRSQVREEGEFYPSGRMLRGND